MDQLSTSVSPSCSSHPQAVETLLEQVAEVHLHHHGAAVVFALEYPVSSGPRYVCEHRSAHQP